MKNFLSLRADFPLLDQKVHGKPIVYLDNAATTPKPFAVMEAMKKYMEKETANIHRGVHRLSELATQSYEAARDHVARLLNAPHRESIIFGAGTTHAINLVAHSFCSSQMQEGDEILISQMEHHSNIVPWQLACERYRLKLRVIPMLENGDLDLDSLPGLFSVRTKLVSLVYISNSVGTINPIRQVIALAHQNGAKVLIDGAQAVGHMRVDVQELDCDFLAFSGHKLYGPTGVGVLYGKKELLNSLPPFLGGGDMIRSVSFEKTTYADLPAKFEAGTPPIAEVIGLGAAVEYVHAIGVEEIHAREVQLAEMARIKLSEIKGVRVMGSPKNRAGIVPFVLDCAHPHDIGSILDQEGVAIRTGHHCCQPVMDFYGVPATARASFGFYNSEDEVSALVKAVSKVRDIFS